MFLTVIKFELNGLTIMLQGGAINDNAFLNSKHYLSTNLYGSLWFGVCNQVASNPPGPT